jgi:hypothetical protein
MELTVKELNEIYYCLGHTLDSDEPSFVNRELVEQLRDKIWSELAKEYDKAQNNVEIFVAP